MVEITTLKTLQDWKTIIGEQCGVIIDPMLCRTAEMFMLGAKEAVHQSQIGDEAVLWKAISQNVDALQTFIDALILRKKLPLIAYWITFGHPDHPITPASIALRDRCNQIDEVLLAVQLEEDAYFPLKKNAIEILNREKPEITDELRTLVLPALSAFDFNWSPNLRDLECFEKSSEDDKKMLTFLYRGVLFSAYAQAAEADEIFQPKLAKLHILSSLRLDEYRKKLQNNLFSGLKKIATEGKGREEIQALVDLPWMPTFLPYLLSKDPKSPQDLFEQAIKLRKTGVVRDYVNWFEEIEKDLDYHRQPTSANKLELSRIRQAIDRHLEIRAEEPITIKPYLAVAFKPTGSEPEAGISIEDIKVYPSKIWGWVTDLFPGHRYRKLLMEMVVAEQRYLELNTQLKKLWKRN
jgi:hypothetical protein